MEKILRTCVVTRYDDTIHKPPFKTIEITSIQVFEPIKNDSGVEFADNLMNGCKVIGETMRFYTSSSLEKYDYEIVVF